MFMYSKVNDYLDSFSGATASHTYVLETKTQGRFQGSPAIITYRVPTKTALQVPPTPLYLYC
jgi:translocon-associated protein subunit beta